MADFNKRVPGGEGDCEGESGERGKRGKRGHRGHDGERGEHGERGEQGERGHDGRDGDTGPTGATGPTGPTDSVATEATPGISLTGDGSVGDPLKINVSAPLTTIVFRPGDPNGDRMNVYTTWLGAYNALASVADLGQVYLEFDARFGSIHIPAGNWIMNDVIWTDYHRDAIETRVTLDDGCSIQITTPGPTLQVVGDSLVIVSDRTGPIAPFVGVNMLFGGVRTRFYNTNPAALPAFVVPAGGTGFIGFKDCPLGGVGNDVALPAPLIDVNGGQFTAVGFSGHFDDNAVTGAGTLRMFLLNDNFNGGLGPAENYNFPAFVGTINMAVRARDRHRVEAVVSASPYNALYNELVRVNTTAIAITVNAPRANPAKGERLVVKDVTGNAATNNITVVGTGGDVVDDNVINVNGQAKTWVSDGAGRWLLVSS